METKKKSWKKQKKIDIFKDFSKFERVQVNDNFINLSKFNIN
jgi:hypothetical protein